MRIPKKDYISDLPVEILEKIFRYVDGKTLARCRIISKRWKEMITNSDYLWQAKCKAEFHSAALHAKRNACPDTLWCSIYRNLKVWPYMYQKIKKNFQIFHKISPYSQDITTADLNQGILIINGIDYAKLLDVRKPRHKPVIINGQIICQRMYSTQNVTALLVKERSVLTKSNSSLYIQRTVENLSKIQETCYSDVKLFNLQEDELYYSTESRNVYKVDLNSNELNPKFCFTSQYEIEEILVKDYSESNKKSREIIAFTRNGYSITYSKMQTVCKTDNLSWMSSHSYTMQYYSVIDRNMFISYLKKVIFISMPLNSCFNYSFPSIKTAVLHHNNIILASEDNKIIHFNVDSTCFNTIGHVPKKEDIKRLCICESNTGPIIMVSTLKRTYLYRANFPELGTKTWSPFDDEVLYERLKRLRDRLEENAKSIAAIRRTRKRKLLDE